MLYSLFHFQFLDFCFNTVLLLHSHQLYTGEIPLYKPGLPYDVPVLPKGSLACICFHNYVHIISEKHNVGKDRAEDKLESLEKQGVQLEDGNDGACFEF